jgi:uncharacterized protein YdbL (DUF1318 family)
MRSHIKPLLVVASLFVVFLFACVTINIYFPAEKVETVAGEIVQDIRGPQEGQQNQTPEKQKDSLLRKTLLAWCAADAWAQDVTEVSNPTIRALKARMKKRFAQMKPYYQKGALKEGANGYVSVGDTGGLDLKQKRDVQALVTAENKDRKTLYAEVAKALEIDPSQTKKIAKIFAKEWQKSVP